MPNWRFLVVRHFGGPHQRRQICAQIKQQVEQHGLSNVLPLVKYELGRQREYYLGVAVDIDASANGHDAEDAARRVLVDAGVGAAANRQFSPIVDAEQVQGLLRGSLECESFTVPISYEADNIGETPPFGHLLAELDVRELQPAEPSRNNNEQYSRLLYWCSAIGSGELGRIQQACQSLGIGSEWGGAWSVLRRLVLLGHMEFVGSGSLRWGIIPPTLVTPALEGEYTILVGQRTPAIEKHLRQQCAVEDQPQPNCPPRLLVKGTPIEGVTYKIGCQVRNAGCVSRKMSELLPAVSDWLPRLPSWDERDFGRFNTEAYDVHTDEFRHIATIAGRPRDGLYRFTLEQSAVRVMTIALFDDPGDRWICGDYYGLRFLARLRLGQCQAIYRADTYQLIVPATDRWPMPYERALVLASGALPQRLRSETGQIVYAYEGIAPDFATRMCELLSLQMEGDKCTI